MEGINNEDLHDAGKTRKQLVESQFVKPGVPAPMVTKDDRKTGVLSSAANAALNEAMKQPNGNGSLL